MKHLLKTLKVTLFSLLLAFPYRNYEFYILNCLCSLLTNLKWLSELHKKRFKNWLFALIFIILPVQFCWLQGVVPKLHWCHAGMGSSQFNHRTKHHFYLHKTSLLPTKHHWLPPLSKVQKVSCRFLPSIASGGSIAA